MWIWPLGRFWTYSPIGFGCAVVWNCCEFAGITCPFAPWLFEKIMGVKGHRVEEKEQ